MLCDYDPRFQEPLARVREAVSLVLMVLAVWEVVRRLAVRLMEESLAVRAQQPELWPVCGRCRRWLRSKGFQPRTLHTLFGVIGWRRRVGRCPNGCKGSQVAPLDQALGLVPHQRTAAEVQWMGWTRLCQRRLVAVLGAIDELSARLGLEGVRAGIRTAV